MAVLPQFPGLEVTVWVGKMKLQEFSDSKGEGGLEHGQVTKYICSNPNTSFKVQVRGKRHPSSFKYAANDIVVAILLDGEEVDGFFSSKRQKCLSYCASGAIDCKNGSWTRRKFFFSKLVTDSSSTKPVDAELLKRIENSGRITVRFWRVRGIGRAIARDHQTNLKTLDCVPETALKGKSLSIKSSLGIAKKIRAEEIESYNHIDPEDEPFASFDFLYRSQHDLKCMGVIPRTPSPIIEVPLDERPVEDLTTEELKELVRIHRMEKQVKIKGESSIKRSLGAMSSTVEDHDELQVVGSTPAKRRRIPDKAEIIDLD